MAANDIRLGVIGMGPANMASTFTLVEKEPDLRYRIQAIAASRAEVAEACAREFNVPVATTWLAPRPGRTRTRGGGL